MVSLVLVQKLILNSYKTCLRLAGICHLKRFYRMRHSTALCKELDWFFATISQIVVSSTYFHISEFGILRSLIPIMMNNPTISRFGALSYTDRD